MLKQKHEILKLPTPINTDIRNQCISKSTFLLRLRLAIVAKLKICVIAFIMAPGACERELGSDLHSNPPFLLDALDLADPAQNNMGLSLSLFTMCAHFQEMCAFKKKLNPLRVPMRAK